MNVFNNEEWIVLMNVFNNEEWIVLMNIFNNEEWIGWWKLNLCKEK